MVHAGANISITLHTYNTFTGVLESQADKLSANSIGQGRSIDYFIMDRHQGQPILSGFTQQSAIPCIHLIIKV